MVDSGQDCQVPLRRKAPTRISNMKILPIIARRVLGRMRELKPDCSQTKRKWKGNTLSSKGDGDGREEEKGAVSRGENRIQGGYLFPRQERHI